MAQTQLPGQQSADVPPGQMLDTAHFVCGLTAHLEAMAKAAGLDVLALYLGMAKAEGDMFTGSTSQPKDTKG
jgi:hypothetical protein